MRGDKVSAGLGIFPEDFTIFLFYEEYEKKLEWDPVVFCGIL